MSQKSGTPKMSSERIVKDIRRATRKQYSAEEKIRIVLDGLRGEHSIAELCRREGIAERLYYTWSKESLAAGQGRPAIEVRLFTSQRTNDFRLSAIVDLPIAGKSRHGAFMPEVLRPKRVPVGFGADSCKANGGLAVPRARDGDLVTANSNRNRDSTTAPFLRSEFMYAIRARPPRRSRTSCKHNMPW
jgi:transposase